LAIGQRWNHPADHRATDLIRRCSMITCGCGCKLKLTSGLARAEVDVGLLGRTVCRSLLHNRSSSTLATTNPTTQPAWTTIEHTNSSRNLPKPRSQLIYLFICFALIPPLAQCNAGSVSALFQSNCTRFSWQKSKRGRTRGRSWIQCMHEILTLQYRSRHACTGLLLAFQFAIAADVNVIATYSRTPDAARWFLTSRKMIFPGACFFLLAVLVITRQ
jgi:hypothetical protein